MLLIILVGFFENCSEGFSTKSGMENLALQCPAAKTLTLGIKTPLEKISCNDSKSYVCESRSFGPNLSHQYLKKNHCSANANLSIKGCIEVNVLTFDSSSAIANTTAAEKNTFLSGGEFNREEIRCSIIDPSGGAAILTVDAPDYDSALRNLNDNCLQAKESAI